MTIVPTRPGDPTGPHWYTPDRLRSLIAANVTEERRDGAKARTMREFVSEFAGLSGTAKQKSVTTAAGLAGGYLHDLVGGVDVDVTKTEALLATMQRESRPPLPRALGILGDHLGESMVANMAGLLGCTDETPTAEDLRDRAVAWVRQGTTEARAEAGSDDTEMIWTYAPGGLPSQWDVTPLPREPALPPPIVWDGEAYYLDLEDFSMLGVYYHGWLRVSSATLRQGIESTDSETARMANDLTRILSFFRARDPLRVISTFRPDAGQSLDAGEDGLITLRGKAVVDEVLGPEWPTEPLVELRQEGLLPLEFPVELVLEGSDGSIAELRVELGQAASVLNWKRVDTTPVVPGEVRDLQEFLAGA